MVLMSPRPLAEASSPSSAHVSSSDCRVVAPGAQGSGGLGSSPTESTAVGTGCQATDREGREGAGEMSAHSCPVQAQTCRGPDVRPRHREWWGVNCYRQLTWSAVVSRPTAAAGLG